jgi:hypothetical protein
MERERHTSDSDTMRSANSSGGGGNLTDVSKHLQFAANVISMTCKCPMSQAYDALLQNIMLYGDMLHATQRTGQEFMEGTAFAKQLSQTKLTTAQHSFVQIVTNIKASQPLENI